MKNALLFVFFIVVCVYAEKPRFDNEEEFDNEDLVKKIQKLIKYGGVEENKEKIQKESSNLSFNEREFLYDENRKKRAGAWSWANFYGIGSFLQGDIKGGIIVAGLEIGGAIIGISMIGNGSKCRDNPNGCEVPTVSNVLIMSGWIYGIVAPILYQSKYNKTLIEALNINDDLSFSIDPLIVPRDGMPAVGLAFNLRR